MQTKRKFKQWLLPLDAVLPDLPLKPLGAILPDLTLKMTFVVVT